MRDWVFLKSQAHRQTMSVKDNDRPIQASNKARYNVVSQGRDHSSQLCKSGYLEARGIVLKPAGT